MNRVYGDAVQVHARADGRPLRFVWRGRPYVVRAILEHWVISREWWCDPAGDQGTEPGQPELEFWRVEAAPDPDMIPGACELRQEIATGAWTLRVDRLPGD